MNIKNSLTPLGSPKAQNESACKLKLRHDGHRGAQILARSIRKHVALVENNQAWIVLIKRHELCPFSIEPRVSDALVIEHKVDIVKRSVVVPRPSSASLFRGLYARVARGTSVWKKKDLRMVLFMAQKMARGKGAVSTK